MNPYKVEVISSPWSAKSLAGKVEERLNELDFENVDIISVSFGTNASMGPSAFIAYRKILSEEEQLESDLL